MDIKKIVVAAALVLLAIIGYNYYSSAQSEKARAARMAETEALRASIPQPEVRRSAPIENDKPEDATRIMSDDELAAASREAEKQADADMEKTKSETCSAISDMSENIMKARLNGVPIQKSLATIDGISADKVYKDAFKDVVIQAYKQPDYRTDEVRERAVREFALKQYLACVSAFDKS